MDHVATRGGLCVQFVAWQLNMTIYIVDPHPLMCDALASLMRRVRPDLEVRAVAKLNHLEKVIEKHGPADLISLELSLPDTLGLSSVHAIKANYPQVPLVVITGHDADEFKRPCLAAGVDAFIEKTATAEQIIAQLRKSLDKTAEPDGSEAPVAPVRLTRRQKQLMLMLDQGLSNAEMASMLQISDHTVKVHFWRLFKVLGVSSRGQALRFARMNGWLMG